MFCSVETARRLERAETALLRDCALAAARVRPDDVVTGDEIGGGLAVFAGAGSPLTKVAGLGYAPLPSEAEMESVEARFAAQGSPVVVELSTLADPAAGAFFTARGYVLHGFEAILGRALSPFGHDDREGVETAVSPESEFEAWLDTVVTGFGTPDTQGVAAHEDFPREQIERAIRDMRGVPGFRRYSATRGAATAGAASMRVFEDVANLCGASTLSEHRRRGVQASLLGRRLSDAASSGCDLAVVTTQPGSKSQENAMRHGFALLYARAILVREAS